LLAPNLDNLLGGREMSTDFNFMAWPPLQERWPTVSKLPVALLAGTFRPYLCASRKHYTLGITAGSNDSRVCFSNLPGSSDIFYQDKASA